MKQEVYNEIKRIIKHNIKPPYGYDFDDLVQDTLIKLVSNKKNTKTDCIKQCKKVAKHLVIDFYRKSKKFKNSYDLEPDMECNQICDIDYIIPKEFEELYILRYKFKMKYKEISTFLGTPLGTVKNRIHKMIIEVKRVNGL